MSTEMNNPSPRELKDIIIEGIQHYFFLNDHVMRGPLCRAVGLLELLKKDPSPIQHDLLEKLSEELNQIDNATKSISQVINGMSKSLSMDEQGINCDKNQLLTK